MSGRRHAHRVGAAAATVLVVAALALLPAAAASAHDYLVSSTPAAGSTVTAAPSAVSLTFDEGVLDLGRGSDGVTVTGPGAATRHFETGCAAVSGPTVTAPVELGGAGRYTIAWRVVSADGHPVSDSIAFTYRPAADAARAAGSATGPDCGVRVAPAQASGTGGGGGLVALVIGVAAGVVLLVGVALVVVVLVLRRSDGSAAEADDGAPDGS